MPNSGRLVIQAEGGLQNRSRQTQSESSIPWTEDNPEECFRAGFTALARMAQDGGVNPKQLGAILKEVEQQYVHAS